MHTIENVIEEFIEFQGHPWLYHSTPSINKENIMSIGISPQNHDGTSWHTERLKSRPNHVYLGTYSLLKNIISGNHNRLINKPREDDIIFGVDIRSLNLEKIKGDEDKFDWTREDRGEIMNDSEPLRPFGLSKPPSFQDWKKESHKTLGEWAEIEKLDKPEHVRHSLMYIDEDTKQNQGSIAYEGVIKKAFLYYLGTYREFAQYTKYQ